MTIFTKSTN